MDGSLCDWCGVGVAVTSHLCDRCAGYPASPLDRDGAAGPVCGRRDEIMALARDNPIVHACLMRQGSWAEAMETAVIHLAGANRVLAKDLTKAIMEKAPAVFVLPKEGK